MNIFKIYIYRDNTRRFEYKLRPFFIIVFDFIVSKSKYEVVAKKKKKKSKSYQKQIQRKIVFGMGSFENLKIRTLND